MEPPSHRQAVERAFTTQADAFEDPARNQVFTADARWVFERLPLSPENVGFMPGDAENLPFLDASFDVVVSRFAAHHLERPTAVVAEMARCTRPGGHVAVVDLVADPDPTTAEEQNRLERLRDPSHIRTLAAIELQAPLTEAGLEAVDVAARPLERPLAPWLEQTHTPPEAADEVRAALTADLADGRRTGFRPRAGEDGAMLFVHTFGSAIAAKPA